MNPRILAALALAGSSLVVTGCGQSSAPAADNKAPPAPVQAAPVQQAAVQAPPPAPAVAAPQPVPAAAPAAAAPVMVTPVMAATVAPVAAAPAKPDRLAIQGFASAIPAAWKPTPTSSQMRVAQFALPAAPGADVGEVAVFYFPRGQGGSQEANIERWSSQFAGPDGKPVAPKVSTDRSGDTEVTQVELNGTYARGVGMGPAGEAKPNQTLLVAMVETPNGRITIQMYGPNKTVSAQRNNFLKVAKGFRPA